MCIAIYKPKNRMLSKETLEVCFENNPDGAGFAYSDGGELHVHKGFFSFEDFWSCFSAIQEDVPAIVHFRIMTSGKKDADNCHPWSVTDHLAIIHNGVISDFSIKDSPISDTGLFVEKVLRPMALEQGTQSLSTVYNEYLIECALGSSKMVSLDADGNFHIYNAGLGEEVDEVWYSNTSFKPKEKKGNNNTPKKTNNDTLHVVFKKNTKYGVIRVGYGMDLLTNKEVHEIRKHYKLKVKKLVARNVLGLVPMDGAVETARYQAKLAEMAITSDSRA